MSRTFTLITLVATLLVAACAGSKPPTATPGSNDDSERKATPAEAPDGIAAPQDEMPDDGPQADPCDGGEVAPN